MDLGKFNISELYIVAISEEYLCGGQLWTLALPDKRQEITPVQHFHFGATR